MSEQLVAVKFNINSPEYTYIWDGEPLKVGDLVEVITEQGNKEVKVCRVGVERPSNPRIKLKKIFQKL